MLVTLGVLWPTDVRCSPVKIYIILSHLIDDKTLKDQDKYRYKYIQNEKNSIPFEFVQYYLDCWQVKWYGTLCA